MMNSRIILSAAFAILFTNNSKAQTIKPMLPDTARKYEVGINIAPALIVLLGAEAAQNYSLCFRTQHNKIGYQIKGVFHLNQQIPSYFPQITFDDSIINVKNIFQSPQKYFAIESGMEFYNPKKKIRWYCGFDLLLRYYQNQISQISYSYTEDTVAYYYPVNTEMTYNKLGFINYNQLGIGAAFKGGVRIPISKHFFIQPETHWEVGYLFPAFVKSHGDVEELNYSASNKFINGYLIPEVNLFYRF